MSKVAVTKSKENALESPSFIEQMNALAERVRQRAYKLFQRRGETDGSEVDDWLTAERELIWAPESDLIENNGRFQLQVAVPGFDPEQVSVTASSDAVTVSAESSHKHDKTEGDVHFCEFGEKTLFRKFDWPKPIDVDKVTAHLEKGVLHISAPKAESELKKTSAAA